MKQYEDFDFGWVGKWVGGGKGLVLLGILGNYLPSGSPNPDPISGPKNVIFHTYFQTWPVRSIPIFIPGFY